MDPDPIPDHPESPSSSDPELEEAFNRILEQAIAYIGDTSITDIDTITWSKLPQILNDTRMRAKVREQWSLRKEILNLCSPDAEASELPSDPSAINLQVDSSFSEEAEHTVEYCDLIVNLHQNVRKLTVQYSALLNGLFPLLLERWSLSNHSRHLTTIYVDGGSYSDEVNVKWWNAIRLIESLRVLSWIDMPEVPEEIRAQGTILPRVTKVVVDNYRWDMVPVFLMFGEGLASFYFASDKDRVRHYDLDRLDQTIGDNPTTIGQNLIKFSFKNKRYYGGDGDDSNNGYDKMFSILCGRFPRLQSCDIFSMINVKFENILVHLRKLPVLASFMVPCPLESFTSEVANQFYQFKSITKMVIIHPLSRDYPIERFETTIGRLFPNLIELTVSSLCEHFVTELNQRIKILFPRIEMANITQVLPEQDREVNL